MPSGNGLKSVHTHIGSRKDGQSQYGPGAFSIRTAGVMFDIAARYRKTDIMETEASFSTGMPKSKATTLHHRRSCIALHGVERSVRATGATN